MYYLAVGEAFLMKKAEIILAVVDLSSGRSKMNETNDRLSSLKRGGSAAEEKEVT
jgi:hypothetical protein